MKKAYVWMYKITQSIHFTNIEKYFCITREHPALIYTRRNYYHQKSWWGNWAWVTQVWVVMGGANKYPSLCSPHCRHGTATANPSGSCWIAPNRKGFYKSMDHASVNQSRSLGKGHGGPAKILTLGLLTRLWKSPFRFQQWVVRLL